MPSNKAKVIKAHAAPTVRVFRVESAQPYGWVVYLEGFATTHFFASRSLALMYAREWAKANVPSEVHVVGPDGLIERWEIYIAPHSSGGTVSFVGFHLKNGLIG